MKYDIVIWGASSFAGKLIAEYLYKNYHHTHSIALAGRSESKLKIINQEYCSNDLPIITGDANDQAFLSDLCQQTRLVISTVGPYALYGESLVKACVKAGIDYCDLTGEPQWIWQMLKNYEKQAQQTGARIMHCCGFDSIPSDIGVYKLQHEAIKQFGSPCQQIHYRFKNTKAGFSGGTVATMINAIKQIKADKQKARILKTPYALLTDKPEGLPFQKGVKGLEKDETTGHYLAPFVMASINTKVVHRTNALLNYPWGQNFLYDEAMQYPANFKGWMQSAKLVAGLSVFALMASFDLSRNILEKYVVPKPGEGPSDDVVNTGFFEVELIGKHENGGTLNMELSGLGDPGYGSTCKMISETAALLLQTERASTGTGFLTPASALQDKLVTQLSKNADISFKLL